MSRPSSPVFRPFEGAYESMHTDKIPTELSKEEMVDHLKALDVYMKREVPSAVVSAFRYPRFVEYETEADRPEFPGFKSLLALVREDALGDLEQNLISMLYYVKLKYFPQERKKWLQAAEAQLKAQERARENRRHAREFVAYCARRGEQNDPIVIE
jgi:hypothetical protein